MGKYKGYQSNICSKCNKLRDVKSKRYCRMCANAYMREWRKTHPLNESQKYKMSVRNKTKTYVKRGLIKKLPCTICLSIENVEAHHPDYNDFKNVVWLCAPCHRSHHADQIYGKSRQLSFNI